MTNFYLYYNVFQKENIQQLLFTSLNKDNFEEALNIIKVVYHFKNFKKLFGTPFNLNNQEAVNINMLDNYYLANYVNNQITEKIYNMISNKSLNDYDLNQIIESIKIFTSDEI
jgi:hypothetical protein